MKYLTTLVVTNSRTIMRSNRGDEILLLKQVECVFAVVAPLPLVNPVDSPLANLFAPATLREGMVGARQIAACDI